MRTASNHPATCLIGRPPAARSGLRIAVVVALVVALEPSAGRADPEGNCPSCNINGTPEELIDQAEAAMVEAVRFQLRAGKMPEDRPAIFLVASREHAERGRTKDALPLAKRAAGECVLKGEDGCAETIAFLAELTLASGAGDEDLEDEALAYLSLLPYERLGAQPCADAVVLRYRLSERRSPRAAEPEWADRCGALGRIGEPGYRAAKAALLQGDLEGAEKRLSHLRAFSHEYAIRATYLFAVIHVARGHMNAAQKAFATIVTLPPSGLRSEEEDDARVLAALQLARVERERGEYAASLAAYQAVPSRSVPRKDALLEGAVVAAHVGDMGAARNYLEALTVYEPQVSQQLDMQRLKANLEVLAGDDENAMATFKTLTELGAKARAESFGPSAPPPLERLQADPTLNGLLDGRDAERLTAIEQEMARLKQFLDENRVDLKALRGELEKGGPNGPLKRSLEKLEGADILLKRAEHLLALREAEGIKVAGPADNALRDFRRARAVRANLDRALQVVRGQHQAQRASLYAGIASVEKDLGKAERALQKLDTEATEVLLKRRELLVQRAEGVVVRLEMAEDLGLAELAWQRKQQASLAVKRAHDEYNEASATLKSDSGVGTGNE